MTPPQAQPVSIERPLAGTAIAAGAPAGAKGPFVINLRSSTTPMALSQPGDPALARWIEGNVRFPDTVVDCIVPAPSREARARVDAVLGLEDRASVERESYAQWVIARDFAGPVPDWAAAGADIVDNIEDYTRLKLHVLNLCHSALAYLASVPAQTSHFGEAPFTWQAFPVVDPQRRMGFDVFCAWQDVSLMSLMFFLSGLLASGSLRRKGAWTYVSDRLWRIGVPFVAAIIFLSPLAFYPAYLARTAAPSLFGFWQQWFSLPFWPSGPE